MGLICTASNSIMHIWGQCTRCSFPKERNQAKKETNAWVPTDEWLWGMQASLVVSTNSKYLSHWALLSNFSQCSSMCANNMISTEEKQQGIQYQDWLILQTSHLFPPGGTCCFPSLKDEGFPALPVCLLFMYSAAGPSYPLLSSCLGSDTNAPQQSVYGVIPHTPVSSNTALRCNTEVKLLHWHTACVSSLDRLPPLLSSH